MNLNIQSENVKDSMIKYVSSDIVDSCSGIVNNKISHPMYKDFESFDAFSLEIKDYKYFKLYDKSLLVIVVGCTGPGEIIFVDSLKPDSVLYRQRINIPSRYVSIDSLADINNDGIPELIIYEDSGSRPQHVILISIYKDKIEFIRDENGKYQFVSPNGNFHLKDLNNDGVYEIILEKMVYKGEKVPADPRIIYVWDGERYSLENNIEY
jgi:hypothetical protein